MPTNPADVSDSPENEGAAQDSYELQGLGLHWVHRTAFCAEKHDPINWGIEVLSEQILDLSNTNSAREKTGVLGKERMFNSTTVPKFICTTKSYTIIL